MSRKYRGEMLVFRRTRTDSAGGTDAFCAVGRRDLRHDCPAEQDGSSCQSGSYQDACDGELSSGESDLLSIVLHDYLTPCLHRLGQYCLFIRLLSLLPCLSVHSNCVSVDVHDCLLLCVNPTVSVSVTVQSSSVYGSHCPCNLSLVYSSSFLYPVSLVGTSAILSFDSCLCSATGFSRACY